MASIQRAGNEQRVSRPRHILGSAVQAADAVGQPFGTGIVAGMDQQTLFAQLEEVATGRPCR